MNSVLQCESTEEDHNSLKIVWKWQNCSRHRKIDQPITKETKLEFKEQHADCF